MFNQTVQGQVCPQIQGVFFKWSPLKVVRLHGKSHQVSEFTYQLTQLWKLRMAASYTCKEQCNVEEPVPDIATLPSEEGHRMPDGSIHPIQVALAFFLFCSQGCLILNCLTLTFFMTGVSITQLSLLSIEYRLAYKWWRSLGRTANWLSRPTLWE